MIEIRNISDRPFEVAGTFVPAASYGRPADLVVVEVEALLGDGRAVGLAGSGMLEIRVQGQPIPMRAIAEGGQAAILRAVKAADGRLGEAIESRKEVADLVADLKLRIEGLTAALRQKDNRIKGLESLNEELRRELSEARGAKSEGEDGRPGADLAEPVEPEDEEDEIEEPVQLDDAKPTATKRGRKKRR